MLSDAVISIASAIRKIPYDKDKALLRVYLHLLVVDAGAVVVAAVVVVPDGVVVTEK